MTPNMCFVGAPPMIDCLVHEHMKRWPLWRRQPNWKAKLTTCLEWMPAKPGMLSPTGGWDALSSFRCPLSLCGRFCTSTAGATEATCLGLSNWNHRTCHIHHVQLLHGGKHVILLGQHDQLPLLFVFSLAAGIVCHGCPELEPSQRSVCAACSGDGGLSFGA